MGQIINATQHTLTESQVNDLEKFSLSIFEENEEISKAKEQLSNLSGTESLEELKQAYINIFNIGIEQGIYDFIMPIGSPLAIMVCGNLLSTHTTLIEERKLRLFFSHTMRNCVETHEETEKVLKQYVFEHIGFNVLYVEHRCWSLRYYPMNHK